MRKETKLRLMKALFSLTMIAFVTAIFITRDMLISKAAVYSGKYIREITKKMPEELTTNGAAHNLYYGQLHSHSTYSDGTGTCKEAYEYASTAPKKMDYFAVTDHSQRFDNHKKGKITDGSVSKEWQEGHKLAKKYTTNKFIALFGYEMTWNASLGNGHMNTFNTPGFESAALTKYYNSTTGLDEYYNKLKTVPQSLSQFNHPGTYWGHFKDFKYVSPEVDRLIQMIEMPGYHKTKDIVTYCKYYQRALDKGWHVSPTNNQDNHGKDWGTLNDKRSVVWSKTLSEKAIYDAIRHNRTYSTEDLDFYLKYTFNGYLMGSKINVARLNEVATIKLSLYDPTDKVIGNLEIVGNNGDVLVKRPINVKKTVVTYDVPTSHSFYYVRIVQPDGDMIVSAPVWIGKYEMGVKASANNTESNSKRIIKAGMPSFFSLGKILNNPKGANGNKQQEKVNHQKANKEQYAAHQKVQDISKDDNSQAANPVGDDSATMNTQTQDIGTDRISNEIREPGDTKKMNIAIAVCVLLFAMLITEGVIIVNIKK